ncbi:MAG TPA: pitrilysin family protein [Bacteroidia bacterium]|nr:pitrilysin family protein [Bacteroidia bacterium]HNU33587.1 pitrilysin family protein [Bacteroidia bacterium]
MNDIFISELKNGFRVVFYQDKNAVVGHCALMIGAGTRNEKNNQSGLAHFIEHMLFKGTKKRKSVQILNRLEVVGGELNAFTSKEETCVHASFLTQHLYRSVELIADIVLNSVFPAKEIEKEKEVIKDEIRMYNDTPSEQIYDDYEAQIFKGSTLGNPILGTNETLQKFKQSDLISFVRNNYNAGKMILSVYGNYSTKQVEEISEELFSSIKSGERNSDNSKVLKRREDQIIRKPISQCHYIIGNLSYSLQSKSRTAMVLLNNILGGPGMNSRLNLAVREKFGYSYAIESGYHAYTDNGVFHLYLATEKKYLNKSVSLAKKELKKLMDKKIGSSALKNYKSQFIGQLALANENKGNVAISASKSMLHFNKPFLLKEVIEKVNAVNEKEIYVCANEVFDLQNMSTLLFEAEN